MSRAILLSILVLFGIFVYLISFEGMIVWPLMVPVVLLVGIYYIITSVVTRRMIEKARGEGDFFSVRASLKLFFNTNLSFIKTTPHRIYKRNTLPPVTTQCQVSYSTYVSALPLHRQSLIPMYKIKAQ